MGGCVVGHGALGSVPSVVECRGGRLSATLPPIFRIAPEQAQLKRRIVDSAHQRSMRDLVPILADLPHTRTVSHLTP